MNEPIPRANQDQSTFSEKLTNCKYMRVFRDDQFYVLKKDHLLGLINVHIQQGRILLDRKTTKVGSACIPITAYGDLCYAALVSFSATKCLFLNSCYADWTRLWSLSHSKCWCEWRLRNIKLVFVLNHSLGSSLSTVFVLFFIASSSQNSKLYSFTRNLVVLSILGLRVCISRSGHLSL